MATYYTYTASHLNSSSAPSGVYSNSGNDITVTSSEAFPTSGSSASVILNVTGSFYAALWTNAGGLVLSKGSNDLIFSTVSGGLSGVTGIGSESPITAGLYEITPIGDQTITPAKTNFSFNPVSFTFNGASGKGVSVSFTATATNVPPEKPTTPTPTDTDTGIVLLPTLSWQAG